MAGRTKHHPNPIKHVQPILSPLISLKGIGPGKAALFGRKGIQTILDLLFFHPIRYEDRTRIVPIREMEEGAKSLIQGHVVFGGEQRFFPSRKRLFKIGIRDGSGYSELIWFQYIKAHLERFIRPGLDLLVYGIRTTKSGRIQMVHPDITVLDNGGLEKRLGFYPVYSSIQGISDHFLRSLIRRSCNDYLGSIIDPLPGKMLQDLGLPGLCEAIHHVHFPPRTVSIDHLNRFDIPWHKRLVFDRFFTIMLIIAFMQKSRQSRPCIPYTLPKDVIQKTKTFFPFHLTSDQRDCIEEIKQDLLIGRPMKRLLVGDVGCGKTVVAALAAYMAVQNHKQVAVMAPTQILAQQHFDYFIELSKDMGFSPVLLSGDQKPKERERIYEAVQAGIHNLIIGTHSLIQKELDFAGLGLVIIDEQHRFGVRQRALLEKKGNNPHILVMTATPIPRTLAITVYGDMDLSMIQEYPRGHQPVDTYIVEEKEKRWAFGLLKERLSAGQQAFVICPAVDESEEMELKSVHEMHDRLKGALTPPYRIGLVHGRLSSAQREKNMDDFHKGRIHILVGTTVVEVGVHVPNATVMIIEHPERFGLAQLHQLRGRVGRGQTRGTCLFIKPNQISTEALSRLKILVETHDGFQIAQKDLELRGHGELMGVRQSGLGELDISEMIQEQELLISAKREAQLLLASDPGLQKSEHRLLRDMIESILDKTMDL